MGGADIVGEVAAPGRADAAGEAEAVVLDLVQARPGHDAADLGFLAEDQQVGQHVEMLAAPVPAGNAHAALDFVEDEQEVVLVANPPQRAQELAAEMVVAALALDRLDDDGGDVGGLLREDVADLFQGQLLFLDDRRLTLGGRQGEVQARGDDARPGELGEVGDLAGVGVRQAQRIAAAPVEGALEVDDLGPALAASGSEVLPDLPIHGGLEGVLDGQGAAFDEEVTVQGRHAHHAGEVMDERGVLDGIDVRVGHLDLGGGEQVGFDFRAVEVGMVEADRLRGVEAVEVNQFPASGGVHEVRAVAAGEVEDELKTVHQDMVFELGYDLAGGHREFLRGCGFLGGLVGAIGCSHAWLSANNA